MYSSAETSKRLREQLLDLEFSVSTWVKSEVMTFKEVDFLLGRDREELSSLYYARLEEYRNLTANSKGLMDDERSQLEEATKQIEQLGAKLEYEINGLRGKVEDVEEGVAEFKRQVVMVEDRVLELEMAMQPKEGWIQWLSRLTGIGKLEGT
jgi:chromosome segregation ATPase